jgi:excisionase family DNA binding protein
MTTDRKSAAPTLPRPPDIDSAGGLKRLLSVKEAAFYLGLSTWSIRDLIGDGSLPVVPYGRRKLLDRKDLDQFIAIRKSRQMEV